MREKHENDTPDGTVERDGGRALARMRKLEKDEAQGALDLFRRPISRRKMVVLSACAVAFAVTRGAAPAYAASPKRYAIVYKLGDGANPSDQVSSIKAGSSIRTSKLKRPSRRGYTFTGWFKNPSLTNRATKVYGKKSKAKRTVYAGWSMAEYELTYSRGGGKFTVALPASYTIDTPTISLIACRKAGQPFGGWYLDQAHLKEARSIKQGSTGARKLYALWNSGSYWQEHLDAKTAQINRVKEQAGATGSSFVFITDMHVPDNCLYSFELIDQIRERCGIKTVVNGGDSINWSTTREEACGILGAVRKGLEKKGCDTFYIRGNHDGNDEGHENDGVTLSDSEYRTCVFGDASYVSDDRLYYFHDDENAKIRYLFLDTGHANAGRLGSEQEHWLVERMKELASSWGIVIFLHRFYRIRKKTQAELDVPMLDPNGSRLTKLLDKHHAEIDAEVIAVISGHSHRDRSTYHLFDAGDDADSMVDFELAEPRPRAGFLAFSTTCDAFRNNRTWPDAHPDRQRGTTDEQAFDVVTIDREARTLTCTRIGCGEDRVFPY